LTITAFYTGAGNKSFDAGTHTLTLTLIDEVRLDANPVPWIEPLATVRRY
jgi:hypothetical protein